MGNAFDLPEAAQKRLKQMRGSDGKPAMFTSDLSVNEFLMVKQAGFAPVGLVMGSSIYHVGYQFLVPGLFGLFWKDQEIGVATQASYNARSLAMSRMIEEANALEADGIIGVRFQLPSYDWGKELLHVVILGTAVKNINGENFRGPKNQIFTSNLNGQDFWTLLKSGHRPLSLIMGNCVYALRQQGILQSFKQLGKNIEVPNYTQAIYAARESAQERMMAELGKSETKPDGVTGVNLEEKVNPHTDNRGNIEYYTIDFFSVGTSVIPYETKEPLSAPAFIQLMK